MLGRLLVNFYLDSLYGFISIGFPLDILQAIQSANRELRRRITILRKPRRCIRYRGNPSAGRCTC